MMKSDHRLLALVLACLVHLSCDSGGIGGTGSISGFGSVFVNGVEWFTDEAEISLDGEIGSDADLRIGMIVVVEGERVGGRVEARELHFDNTLQGPVDAIYVISSTATDVEILGQSVSLSQATTEFDASDPGFSLESLALGDVLEVSGHVDGDGLIYASWVQRLGVVEIGATAVELEGAASNPSSSGFLLGSITVVTDAETDFDEVPAPPTAGMTVEVEGTLIAPDTVRASEVSIPIALANGLAELSIESFVSEFQGLSNFRVGGQRVDASLASFEPVDPSFLAEGVLVEVEGQLVDGVLRAREVRLEEPEFEIEADLASLADVDAAAGTLVLAGVELNLGPNAELQDEVQGGGPLSLAELAAGDRLEVEGSVSGGICWVEELQRVEATNGVLVSGPVTDMGGSSLPLEVLGVPVPTGPQTAFFNDQDLPVSAAEFSSALQVGLVVSASDSSGSDPTRIHMASTLEAED